MGGYHSGSLEGVRGKREGEKKMVPSRYLLRGQGKEEHKEAVKRVKNKKGGEEEKTPYRRGPYDKTFLHIAGITNSSTL